MLILHASGVAFFTLICGYRDGISQDANWYITPHPRCENLYIATAGSFHGVSPSTQHLPTLLTLLQKEPKLTLPLSVEIPPYHRRVCGTNAQRRALLRDGGAVALG